MTPEEAKGLPESIQDWNEVKEATSLDSFWDGMKNMRTKMGTGLYQPGKDAGSEDWGKFSSKAVDLSDGRLMPKPDLTDESQRNALYKTLGVPDDVKDYEFAEIEGTTIGDDRKEFIREIAKENNLTKAQLTGLDKRMREKDLEIANGNKVTFDQDLKTLRSEWGLASDDRFNSAKKVQKIFFPHIPEDTDLSAAEIQSFYTLFKQLNTDSTEFQEQNHNDSGGLTKDDAILKLATIRNNKDHPYNNPLDPGYAAAKKEVRNLYLAKNGLPPE